jgi:hypothetical protein
MQKFSILIFFGNLEKFHYECIDYSIVSFLRCLSIINVKNKKFTIHLWNKLEILTTTEQENKWIVLEEFPVDPASLKLFDKYYQSKKVEVDESIELDSRSTLGPVGTIKFCKYPSKSGKAIWICKNEISKSKTSVKIIEKQKLDKENIYEKIHENKKIDVKIEKENIIPKTEKIVEIDIPKAIETPKPQKPEVVKIQETPGHVLGSNSLIVKVKFPVGIEETSVPYHSITSYNAIRTGSIHV